MGERDICTSWVVSTELEGTVGLILVLKIGNIGIMLRREGNFSKVAKGTLWKVWIGYHPLKVWAPAQAVHRSRFVWELKGSAGKGLSVLLAFRLTVTREVSFTCLFIVLAFPAICCPLCGQRQFWSRDQAVAVSGPLVFCPLGFLRGMGLCDWPHMGKSCTQLTLYLRSQSGGLTPFLSQPIGLGLRIYEMRGNHSEERRPCMRAWPLLAGARGVPGRGWASNPGDGWGKKEIWATRVRSLSGSRKENWAGHLAGGEPEPFPGGREKWEHCICLQTPFLHKGRTREVRSNCL